MKITLKSTLPLDPQKFYALPEVTRTGTADLTRILFVGNSYFYCNNSLHDHIKRMAAGIRASDNPKFKSVTINGGILLDHDISDYLEPGKFRMERPFQVVVLQATALPHSLTGIGSGSRRRSPGIRWRPLQRAVKLCST